jgi:hypothetical protein
LGLGLGLGLVARFSFDIMLHLLWSMVATAFIVWLFGEDFRFRDCLVSERGRGLGGGTGVRGVRCLWKCRICWVEGGRLGEGGWGREVWRGVMVRFWGEGKARPGDLENS